MLKLLLKIAGKNDFAIDKSIGLTYLLRICIKYGMMLVRGYFRTILCKRSGKVFIGKSVSLYVKSKIQFGKNVKIHDGVKIDALSQNGVSLGDNVVIGRDSVIECTGSLTNVGQGVEIGSGTTFGCGCYFGAAGGIKIGSNVVAGQFVRFHSENHNYSDPDILIKNQGVIHKGIVIGNNVWIGAGVVFLDGVIVEDGCVIGANSVVTKHIPANSVIAGVPAKVLKGRCQ